MHHQVEVHQYEGKPLAMLCFLPCGTSLFGPFFSCFPTGQVSCARIGIRQSNQIDIRWHSLRQPFRLVNSPAVGRLVKEHHIRQIWCRNSWPGDMASQVQVTLVFMVGGASWSCHWFFCQPWPEPSSHFLLSIFFLGTWWMLGHHMLPISDGFFWRWGSLGSFP